jgi:hypothetical protein
LPPLAVGALVRGGAAAGVPGQRAGPAAALAAALLALVWAIAAADVASAPAAARPALILGHTALPCVVLIALLSLPILTALFVALRSLAPTWPLAAGAAAARWRAPSPPPPTPCTATRWRCRSWPRGTCSMAIPAVLGSLLATRWLRWS